MAGRFEGMNAVASELLRTDVISDGVAGSGVCDQLPDQSVQLMLGLGDLIIRVEQDGHFGPMRLGVMVSNPFTLDMGESG
jgi:hypothetical protein